MHAGTITVSAVTSSSSPASPPTTKPGPTAAPGSVAQTCSRYQGSTRSGRGMPNTSHGTATSKIGAPGITASATRCVSVLLRMTAMVPLLGRLGGAVR